MQVASDWANHKVPVAGGRLQGIPKADVTADRAKHRVPQLVCTEVVPKVRVACGRTKDWV